MSTLESFSANAGCSWSWTDSHVLGPTTNRNSAGAAIAYTNGAGANQVDRVYRNQHTIAALTTLSLDLAGGLVDFEGVTITMARVKSIYVRLRDTPTAGGPLLLGGGAAGMANLFETVGDRIRVRQPGHFEIACGDATGYALTAATADDFEIRNEHATIAAVVDVVIAGSAT